jgi:uncharacterized protein (DUF1800 family)
MRLVMTRRLQAAFLAVFLGVPAVVSAQRTNPSEAEKVVHLLQRATFGVRPQDVQAALAMGRTKWLERQLSPSQIEDRAVKQRLDTFATVSRDMTDLFVDYERERMEQRQRRRQLNMQEMNEQERQAKVDSIRRAEAQRLTPAERQARQMRSPQYLLGELVAAKLTRSVYSERQLEEVMTDFWYNHFNIFFGKNLDRYFVADYERNAIRPHVFGKFRDMLEATARHPAMLFYLDNATSVAADSMNGLAPRQRALLDQLRRLTPMQREEFLRQRNMNPKQMDRLLAQANGQANRQRGLNENYARELMELHTLGVDGGYTQKDVVEVARAFTGWQFTRPGPRSAQEVEFVFRPQLHDRGEKWVLGQKLAGGRGMEDGEQVLDLLARHPSTAKFLARKLVERFVSDSPDPAFVNELAHVFQTTDGDLRAVTRALFSSPRFYDARYQRTKIKTPFELVASAYRVTGAEVGFSRATVATLRSFGHLPYSEPAPTGFPAASEDWVNSGAMLNRMNFGLALAANRLEGVRIEANGKATGTSVEARVPVMLQQLMPGVNTAKLQNTILTELKKPVVVAPEQANEMANRRNARNAPNAPVRDQAARALGLALGSPEFQRK